MQANPIQLNSDTRLYIVFPHPDDELFGCGGLIQYVLSLGGTVQLDILSRGEASTLRHGLSEDQDLAAAREVEFGTVCKALGVVNFKISRFVDGGMRNQQPEICDYIKAEIAAFNPTHVATYEPCGVYGHPDHVAVSQCVQRIFEETKAFTLLYTTVPVGFEMPQENLLMADDPSTVKPAEPTYIYKLKLGEMIKKIKCFGLYKSQVQPSKNIVENLRMLRLLSKEYFHVLQP